MNPETRTNFSGEIDDKTNQVEEEDKERRAVLEYFKANEKFLTAYAQDSSFRVKPGGFNDAQGNYIGFAIDLENGELYADPKFFSERGYSPPKAMVGFLHELEHLRELAELLGEKDGIKIWQKQGSRFRARPRLQVLDNCVADARENRSIQTRAPAQKETLADLYREDLFPEKDLQDKPLHLQFVFSLLREAMIPEEKAVVDSRVRAEVDRLSEIRTQSGAKLVDFLTRPDLSPSVRLKLQESFLEPVYEGFFQEDIEKAKSSQSQSTDEEPTEGQEGKAAKPEDYFEGEYKDFFNRRSPRATLKDKINEEVKKYQETKGKSDAELLAEAYARAEGVNLQDIKAYQDFWRQIEELKNPETDEKVVEELRALFRRIIAERKKPVRAPKVPTTDGQVLIKPVRAHLDALAGKEESLAWLSIRKKEKTKELYGHFDITWVKDRSGSMNEGNGQKRVQQKIGNVLCLEAIKEFCDDLDEARADIQQDLAVRTEEWSFGSDAQVEILKPLSKELTEKQRVGIFKKLDDCPGSTKDFLALEKIKDGIPDEDLDKIRDKKLRKIIIVSTDGGSDDATRLKAVLQDLRAKGIAVVAVGNGIEENSSDALNVRTNYAYEDGRLGAQICPRAEQTPIVLADLLKIFLSELM